MTFWSILRQRCWGLVLVVAGVCVITFIISHLIPGDPARLLAGDRASDAIVENIRQQLGLDQPLYVQFYRYVSDLFHGDLGTSIRTGRPVLEDLQCVATSHLTGINAGVRSPGNCRSPDPLSDAGTIE